MVRHRRTANAIAQLRKADSNRLGGLRQEARAGHPWNGIDFKTPWLSRVVQSENNPAVGACFHSTMSRERERANEVGCRPRQSSGKDFFGPVRLVLARVIKDVVKLWANFADR
jgi:hypothetical protein